MNQSDADQLTRLFATLVIAQSTLAEAREWLTPNVGGAELERVRKEVDLTLETIKNVLQA